MGQNFYHGMLMPLRDSMPSFMDFKGVLDLLEFKNEVTQCLRPSDGQRVISCMGPKHAPKDTYLIFNQFICTKECACGSNLNYAHNSNLNYKHKLQCTIVG